METNETYTGQIAAHLKTASVKRAAAKMGVNPEARSKAAVPAWLSTLFLTVFLPILPAVLGVLGAKIMANPKLARVLEATYTVLGGLLGKTPAE